MLAKGAVSSLYTMPLPFCFYLLSVLAPAGYLLKSSSALATISLFISPHEENVSSLMFSCCYMRSRPVILHPTADAGI